MSHVEEGTLHAMLDGELTGTEVVTVKAHLDQCASCRALLAEVKEFVAEADTLIVALDETGPAGKGGQADGRSGGQADGKAVGRYGGNVRPWYRRPQFLATAATLTLAIGAGYIGLALRDQGMLTDRPELLSEADAPVVGTSAGAARAAGAVCSSSATMSVSASATNSLTSSSSARHRAH